MSLQTVTFNDRISFALLVDSKKENVIYCKSVTEHFFNVGLFSTDNSDLLLEYYEENGEKFTKVNVQLGDTLYKEVEFKIVVSDSNISSTFNPSYTKPIKNKILPKIVEEKLPVEVLEREIIEEPAPLPPIEYPKVYRPLKVGELYDVAINSSVPMTLMESDEVENIFFCSSFEDKLFNVGIFKTADAELISEYSVEQNDKYIYVDLLFENGDLYHKIQFKIIVVENEDTPISMFNLKTLDNETKTYVKFTGTPYIPADITEEEKTVDSIITEDTELIEKKQQYAKAIQKARLLETQLKEQQKILYQKQEELQKQSVVIEAATEVEKLIWENIQLKLETFKRDFSTEFKKNSKKSLDEYIVEKLKQDFEKTTEIDEKIAQLVEQAENTNKIRDGIKKYVDKAVEVALREAKKFAASIGGGGGSVAVQYANGGTMNGDLTVNGELQVNGSFNICGDLLPCTTDIYSLGSPTKRWKDLYVSDSSIYLGNVTLSAVGNTLIIPEDTLFIGNAVQDGDLNVTTSILSAGVDLLDVFGSNTYIQYLSWAPLTYDLSITGGNTVSLLSIKNDYQAYTQNYTKTNFLPLTGGVITGNLSVNNNLTVFGNLTALGDAYFVNTVFSTTSALSVINIGQGPALYVYQAAGPHPVASFVDGDGIEVLHVGNAQPGSGGKIGINTSNPITELTVSGSISANGSITVANGNSNNWNSVYTSVENNSSNWNSVYTSSSQNSGSWNSVYTSWNTTSSIYVTTHFLSTNNVLLSAVTVTDDINVGGTGYFSHIAAATKSFYIIHPEDTNKHLQYGSLESPYHGVRLTGKAAIGIECCIELPPYIKSLVKLEGVNVQITNINHTQQLYVKNIDIDKNCVVIGRKHNILNKNKLYEFFWSFTAIRKDIPDLKTEV